MVIADHAMGCKETCTDHSGQAWEAEEGDGADDRVHHAWAAASMAGRMPAAPATPR